MGNSCSKSDSYDPMYKQYKSSSMVPALVDPAWLDEKIKADEPNFRVLDASWHLPMMNRNAKEEYLAGHLPKAVQFDQNDCYDDQSQYDLMIPSAEKFSQYVGSLGVTNDTHVVLYDSNANFGLFSAQRAWWLFRVFGHQKVSILNGGLPRWKAEGFPVVTEVDSFPETSYSASLKPEILKTFEQIEEGIDSKAFQLVDARSPPRFNGTGPELVQGVKPGHIPGSINLPFPKVLDPEKKVMKQPEELQAIFKEHGVDLNKPLVASCGSGVSGCMLVLAAYTCGKEDVALYDGSWTEWYLRAKPEQKEDVPEGDV